MVFMCRSKSAIQEEPLKFLAIFKPKTLVNRMELSQSRLLTGKATKSIYDNADTKDKCITLSD